MEAFEAWMAETGQDENRMNELALAGWISADMFVTSLRLAGPEFTRETMISEMNTLTDYTARASSRRSTGHKSTRRTSTVAACSSRSPGGRFVPEFDNGRRPTTA